MLISESVEKGEWKPVQLSRGGVSISHLLFADDILLFTEVKSSQLHLVLKILKEFELALGLRVNVEKSKAMVSKGVSRHRKKCLIAPSLIVFASHLGKYLGFHLLKVELRSLIFIS